MCICTGLTVSAQSSTTQIAVFSLRGYGWQPPDPIHPHEIDTVGGHSIAIDHQGRVLVGFVVRERNGLVTRNHPALYFRIIRLALDGKVDLSLSLPASGWRTNSLYLSDTDQIIVRADDKLQLLQGDSAAEKNVWNDIAPCGPRCQVLQSPSRRTLLLDTWDVDPPITVIDSSQFPNVRRCERVPYPIASITDKFAYYTGQTPRLEMFTYRWPLCDYENHVNLPAQMTGRATALNDRSFVTGAADGDLETISPDGHVEFRQPMAKHEQWDNFFAPIRSSERGDRIAVDILTMRGGNQTLDISAHATARRIAVYDIETGKELASVPVNPVHHFRFDFDLSSDGHCLAILEDDIVKVVDLGN